MFSRFRLMVYGRNTSSACGEMVIDSVCHDYDTGTSHITYFVMLLIIRIMARELLRTEIA